MSVSWSRPEDEAETERWEADKAKAAALALDLSDPHVRVMADRNHEPDEMWNMGGRLMTVHCRTCVNEWPCPTRRALDELEQAEHSHQSFHRGCRWCAAARGTERRPT